MLLLWMACGDVADPMSECLSEYSADAGYGWESDGGAAAGDVEAECEAAGGTGCAAADFITRDAAFCLASLENLPEGVLEWTADLVYHTLYETVVWNVTSTLVSKDGYATGENLSFDATTGETLGRTGWEATP